MKLCENIELLSLARLHYLNCADQLQCDWDDYLSKNVISVIDEGPKAVQGLFNSMQDIQRSRPATCKCRIALVDEISKIDKLSNGMAEKCRSIICKWLDEGKLFDGVLFSSLSVDFMTRERSASGRPVLAIATLPLLSASSS